MSDILDYISWRGDLSFLNSPINEVDALILSQLSYLNFKEIVPENFDSTGLTLAECSERFFNSADYESRSNVGMLINKKTIDLLKACGNSVRFGGLELLGYVERIDYHNEEQFCAVTFKFNAKGNDGWHFVAYRGTDDTIVGWKEDFNLGYMETVPAQRDSVEYLEKVFENCKGRLIVGGHSKGGNLALYAGSNVNDKIKKRIVWIFNNDGPGFSKSFFSSDGYKAIKEKERSFVPRLSVIGMLFCHSDVFTTVQCDEKGMLIQHDPFTWHVLGNSFVTCEQTGRRSHIVDKAVNEWFDDMTKEEREAFVETIFTVLNDTDAKTNSELSSNLLDSVGKILKATSKLSADKKNAVGKNVYQLLKAFVDEAFSSNHI